MESIKPKRKYLFKVLPIFERAWVNLLVGGAWLTEAFAETTLFYYWAPPYVQQIINPINVTVFLSTYTAVIIGCIHAGIGISKLMIAFKKWRGYIE